MRTSKKIVSILLTLCMLLSAIPLMTFTASATSYIINQGGISYPYSNYCWLSISSPSSTVGAYAEAGETVTVKACIESGYENEYALGTLAYSTDGGRTMNYLIPTNNVATFTMPTSTITIYPSFGAAYTVTCSTPENGTLSVNQTKIGPWGYVYVTATPDEGCVLESLTYTKEGETTQNDIDIDSDGVASFRIPNCNVTVNAKFKKI